MAVPKDISLNIRSRSTKSASIGSPGIGTTSAGEDIQLRRITIMIIVYFTDIFEVVLVD
jgi:hypothetical protein